MSTDLFIEPECPHWQSLIEQHHVAVGSFAGRTLVEWRAATRHELDLAVDRPVIATGHQTLLWHPGILAKYFAAHAFAQLNGHATANLIVDQHAEGFGSFDIPIRRRDDTLAARRIELTAPRPGVPMGLHEPFEPAPLPQSLQPALPAVEFGTKRIHDAIAANHDAPNAARQMARALNDLMIPWIEPMPPVCASSLVTTEFSRALLEAMICDPQHCAQLYNRAPAAVPEAGIGQLLIRDDYVELPLWRIRPDGSRMHAYDNDLHNWLDDPSSMTIMPRALFMTALIRLVMCDIFVHGTGAAVYDRAMELWVHDWLGLTPAPKVVATANVYLPLQHTADAVPIAAAQNRYRTTWHDPQAAATGRHPSATKQQLLDAINIAPRRSPARRQAFFTMHEQLDGMRHAQADAVLAAEQQLRQAERAAANQSIATRRDWPFPLYPTELIDDLADAVHRALSCPPCQMTTQQVADR